jgi:predicted dehydrogenase
MSAAVPLCGGVEQHCDSCPRPYTKTASSCFLRPQKKEVPISRRHGRRDFLQQAGLAGLGFWAAGTATAQDRTPGANDRLNVAVLGVGGRGRANLDAVRHENVVALCDVDANRLGQAAETFPRAERFADYRRLFDRVRNLDAVVVATPDHHHAPATALALRTGKHVYCEKPLTHSVHESRVVTALARERRVATQMGNQGHSGANSHRVVELLRANLIGSVREVHAWTDRPGRYWTQGLNRPKAAPEVPANLSWDVWLGPAPVRPYHPAYVPFRWRGWWDFGTGALGDMACHITDVAFWALRLGLPQWVEAEQQGMTIESGPRASTIRYQFPARGELPAVRLTWYDGGRTPPRELTGQDLAGTNGSLFVGSEGRMLLVRHGREFALLPRERFADVTLPERRLQPPEGGHHAEWLRACRDRNATTGSNFAYAGPMTEAILLGNVALRVGGRIAYDAEHGRVTNEPRAEQYLRRDYRRGWSL